VAVRPFSVSVICHSKVSPGWSWRYSGIPSGMVALRLRDFGQAIDVFDVSGMAIQILTRKQRGDMIARKQSLTKLEQCLRQVPKLPRRLLRDKDRATLGL
jgi:hypothetical protein